MSKTGVIVGVSAGVAAVGTGTYLYVKNGGHIPGLPESSAPGPGGQPSVYGGIPAVIQANYTGSPVSGPSPGPRGEYEFPSLWSVAPQTLPSQYLSGPAITRRCGQVWLVIAENLDVSGTYNDQNAANQGPWVGIAEFSDGTLVRVYPQQASNSTSASGALSGLGSWSGGYAC